MTQLGLMRIDLKQEQRRSYRGAALACLVCSAVLAAAHVAVTSFVQQPADDLEARLTVWAIASVFVLVSVMLGIAWYLAGDAAP